LQHHHLGLFIDGGRQERVACLRTLGL
jgi:hypothetical protein